MSVTILVLVLNVFIISVVTIYQSVKLLLDYERGNYKNKEEKERLQINGLLGIFMGPIGIALSIDALCMLGCL